MFKLGDIWNNVCQNIEELKKKKAEKKHKRDLKRFVDDFWRLILKRELENNKTFYESVKRCFEMTQEMAKLQKKNFKPTFFQDEYDRMTLCEKYASLEEVEKMRIKLGFSKEEVDFLVNETLEKVLHSFERLLKSFTEDLERLKNKA